jgi:hypothetical protein
MLNNPSLDCLEFFLEHVDLLLERVVDHLQFVTLRLVDALLVSECFVWIDRRALRPFPIEKNSPVRCWCFGKVGCSRFRV